MKRLIACVALALAAGCAEVEMRGIVRDQATGEPLPGATIRVGDRETTTDLTGQYDFDVDESGKPKQIIVHKAGYQPYVEDITIDEDRADEVVQDFDLQPLDERSSKPGRTLLPEQERDDD